MVLKRITATVLAVMLLFVCFATSANAATFTSDVETVSKAIYLLNLDTDTLVYEKNSNDKLYPASTTKIMTYIVTVENVKDIKNTKVVVNKDILDELAGTGSSLSGLEYFVGQTVTVYDLLNCLMIKSGNDAALLLADFVGDGSVQNFVDMMNEKAAYLGMTNTHFANPNGLPNANNYSTASDLVRLSRYCMRDSLFAEIVGTVEKDVFLTDGRHIPCRNTNALLSTYEGCFGIKTGFTRQAGNCLASVAKRDDITLYLVLLNSRSMSSRFTESAILLDYGFNVMKTYRQNN